jgi:hypothetical protein
MSNKVLDYGPHTTPSDKFQLTERLRAEMNSNRNCRWVAGVGIPIAAGLIGLAPAARADGPFEDLFGDTGFNSWTPAADASLLSSAPTLAATLDTSVEQYIENVAAADPITTLTSEVDPSAFTFSDEWFTDAGQPILTVPVDCTFGCNELAIPIPQDGIGDVALGSDYLLSLTGVDAFGNPLDFVSAIEFDLVFFPVLALGALFGI